MLALATSTVLAALVGHFLASFLDPNLLEIAAGLTGTRTTTGLESGTTFSARNLG